MKNKKPIKITIKSTTVYEFEDGLPKGVSIDKDGWFKLENKVIWPTLTHDMFVGKYKVEYLCNTKYAENYAKKIQWFEKECSHETEVEDLKKIVESV
jgi:hypothetical protein